MYVGDLFEKKSKEKNTDLYKTTKYADTRKAIDSARKEYPGATDVEALAAHGWNQDVLNQKQQKEIDQLRRDEKQIVKDLKDKEKRFQDFTKAVAGMDLTPPEQARAAQDIEQGREPKIPEKPKAKFDPVTGTPTAMPKTSTPRAQAPSTAIPATMPTIGATAPATDKQAPAQQAQPQATTQRAQPQAPTAPATSPAIAQMARQLTPGRVIKGRGQPANQPAQQLPAGVADLSQARADRETKLAQAGLGGLATGTYGLEEQSVPTGAGNEEIADKNEKRIVQAYLGDTSAKLEFLTGLPLPLNKQQVYALVDAFALIPNGANKDALKINLFSNRTFLIEWMFENIVNPATPTNRPTDVDQKELDQDQGQQLALEGDVIPMTGRPQVPDEVKAYQYALEILKAAFDERVPTAKVDQMKQILFHDFQARIQQAPDETYYLNRNGVKSRLPDPRTLPMEDSWHDGQSAWSSEHDQWAKESTDPVIALTGVDESSNDFMAVDSTSPVGGKTNENRLSVGDPIKVIGPNEFEGATGEIVAFSPISGTFVIVDLYNHGKHSMHLSDVEYNDYADRDQDDLDESESLSDIDIMRQDLEQMTDRQFLTAYGMSKIAFQQRYRTLLKPAPQQSVPVKESNVNPQFVNAEATKLLVSAGRKFDNRSAAEILAPLMKQYGLTIQQIDQMIPGGLTKLAKSYGIFKEGYQDFNKVEPYAVCLAGKPVKTFDIGEGSLGGSGLKGLETHYAVYKKENGRVSKVKDTNKAGGPMNSFQAEGYRDMMIKNNPTRYNHDNVWIAGADIDLGEAANRQQQAAIAINMKKHHKKPKGVAEGRLEANTPNPVVVIQDLKGNILDTVNLSVAVQKYKLGNPQDIKNQLAHQNYTTIGNYVVVSPMSGQPQDNTTQGVAEGLTDTLKSIWRGLKAQVVDIVANAVGLPDDQRREVFVQAGNEFSNEVIKLLANHPARDKLIPMVREIGGHMAKARTLEELKSLMDKAGVFLANVEAGKFNPPSGVAKTLPSYRDKQGVEEDRGSWIVFDPVTKQIRKRFKTHTAGKSYAKAHGLGFASSEYYFDNIKQPVNEFSPGGGATLPPVKPPKNDGDRWEDEDDDNNGWHPGKRTEEDLHNPLGDQIKALLKKKNTIVWYPWADQEQNTKYRTQAVIRQITGEQIVNGRHMVSFKYCWRPWYKTANGMEQGGWRCDQSHLPPDAHKWLALGPVGSKTYEIQDLSKNPDWKDPRSPEEIEWRKRLDDLDEAETDYSKRRQRERDIDAGKPVAKQRQPKMTDYQKRRAQQKKEMELGETTNYWTKLQNERSKKLNSLVNELKESIK
jgi:hypothetical protein